jgi:hypothetical protein
MSLENSPDLVRFVYWSHGGIIGSCQNIVAGFSAHPAVNATHHRGSKVPADPFAEEFEESLDIMRIRVIDFEIPFSDRRKFLIFGFFLRISFQRKAENIFNIDLFFFRLFAQRPSPPVSLIFF